MAFGARGATRLRRSDPGHPESCNLYEFHKLLSPTDVAERVARECRTATIGCVDDKKLLAEQLNAFLEPIQRRRAELLRERGALLTLLREGSERARERARETMALVRGALGMDYEQLLRREPQ